MPKTKKPKKLGAKRKKQLKKMNLTKSGWAKLLSRLKKVNRDKKLKLSAKDRRLINRLLANGDDMKPSKSYRMVRQLTDADARSFLTNFYRDFGNFRESKGTDYIDLTVSTDEDRFSIGEDVIEPRNPNRENQPKETVREVKTPKIRRIKKEKGTDPRDIIKGFARRARGMFSTPRKNTVSKGRLFSPNELTGKEARQDHLPSSTSFPKANTKYETPRQRSREDIEFAGADTVKE